MESGSKPEIPPFYIELKTMSVEIPEYGVSDYLYELQQCAESLKFVVGAPIKGKYYLAVPGEQSPRFIYELD